MSEPKHGIDFMCPRCLYAFTDYLLLVETNVVYQPTCPNCEKKFLSRAVMFNDLTKDKLNAAIRRARNTTDHNDTFIAKTR